MFLHPFRLAAVVVGACLVSAGANAQACSSSIPKGELIAEGTLMLSTNPTLRPLQYVDGNGQIKGMNVDLANEIGKRLCLKIDLVRMDFPAMIPALKSGRFDGRTTFECTATLPRGSWRRSRRNESSARRCSICSKTVAPGGGSTPATTTLPISPPA